jgi:hypothetical protein
MATRTAKIVGALAGATVVVAVPDAFERAVARQSPKRLAAKTAGIAASRADVFERAVLRRMRS